MKISEQRFNLIKEFKDFRVQSSQLLSSIRTVECGHAENVTSNNIITVNKADDESFGALAAKPGPVIHEAKSQNNEEEVYRLLMDRYQQDKALQHHEYRKHSYNKKELYIDRELLADCMKMLEACQADGSKIQQHLRHAINLLNDWLNEAYCIEPARLSNADKQELQTLVAQSQQATNILLSAALIMKTSNALKEGERQKGNTPDEIAEAKSAFRKIASDIKEFVGNSYDGTNYFLSFKLFNGGELQSLREKHFIFTDCLRQQISGDINALAKNFSGLHSQGARLSDRAETFAARMMSAAGNVLFAENQSEQQLRVRKIRNGLKKAPERVYEAVHTQAASWTNLIKQGSSATMRVLARTTAVARQHLTPENVQQAAISEALRLHASPVYLAMGNFLDACDQLLLSPPHEKTARSQLRQVRKRAINALEENEKHFMAEASALIKQGTALSKSIEIESLEAPVRAFWEQAAEIDNSLNDIIKQPEQNEEEQPLTDKARSRYITATGRARQCQHHFEQAIISITGKPFDFYSVDWNIARDIGRYFYTLRQAYTAEVPMALFDRAAEKAMARIATDFSKPHSPDGKQMAMRAVSVYRDSLRGMLPEEKNIQAIMASQITELDYLVKSGQKSLVGRLIFAAVSGNMKWLTDIAANPIMRPHLSLLKVLLSPYGFWSDYRKLRQAVRPGYAYPRQNYWTMRRRDLFKQLFRLVKLVLPGSVKTGVALGLAGYALYEKGIKNTVTQGGKQAARDFLLAGGYVSARSGLNQALAVGSAENKESRNWQVDEHPRSLRVVRDTSRLDEHGKEEESVSVEADGSLAPRLTTAEIDHLRQYGASERFLIKTINDRMALLERGKSRASSLSQFYDSFIHQLKASREKLVNATRLADVRDAFNASSEYKISLYDVLRGRILDGTFTPEDLSELYGEIDDPGKMIDGALNEIFREHGETGVTAESCFKVEFYSHGSAGYMQKDESAFLPKRLKLSEIATGDHYKQYYNGHIKVLGLPPAIEKLFSKNTYYENVFPVTEKLYEKVTAKFLRAQSSDVKQLRSDLWQGRISKTLSALRPEGMDHNELRQLFDKGSVYRLRYEHNGTQYEIANVFLVHQDNKRYRLFDLNQGKEITVNTDFQHKPTTNRALKSIVLDNVSVKDKMNIESRVPHFVFEEQQGKLPPKLIEQFGLNKNDPQVRSSQIGMLSLVRAGSSDELAHALNEQDYLISRENLTFRFTRSRDVALHALIDQAKNALRVYGIALTFARLGPVTNLLLNAGIGTAEAGLSYAQISTAKTLKELQDAQEEFRDSVIFGIANIVLSGRGSGDELKKLSGRVSSGARNRFNKLLSKHGVEVKHPHTGISAATLNKRIIEQSQNNPHHNFICYIAAANDAEQAGAITTETAEWLKNILFKKHAQNEILNSIQYKNAFGLSNKSQLTMFQHVSITESGFIHLGSITGEGIKFHHVIYVHKDGNKIYLYQANGNNLVSGLTGQRNIETFDISKGKSDAHFNHELDEETTANFNRYFSQPKNKDKFFVFTPASEVNAYT